MNAGPEQLASIAEAAPDLVLIGHPNGRVEWMNAAGRRLLAIDPQADVKSYRIEDMFSAEEMARIYAEDMPVLSAEGRWRGEWTLQALDHQQIPVEVTAYVHDEDHDQGRYVSAIMRDLRPRRAQERELQESERRLAAAELVAGLGSWEWNLATGDVTWSPGIFRLHGLDPAVVQPSFETWLATVHPDDVARVVQGVQEASQRVGSLDFTYQGMHTDGRTLVLRSRAEVTPDERGAPARMVGTALDVTEQHEVERALRGSEQRARSIIDTSVVAYVEVDEDDLVTDWNPQAEVTYGWTREEALGRDLSALALPPDRRLDDVASPGPAPAAGVRWTQRRHFEATGQTRSGRHFPVEIVVWPIESDGGRVFGSFHRDISERRALEQAKNEFVSVVSHELRTPLTSIHGALGLLRTGLLGDLNDRGQRMVDIAVDNTDRLVRLINDILDIERLESGNITLNRRRCDAASLVDHSAELMRPMADKAGVGLSVDTQEATVWADPDRVEQTVTNLLSNAIKFSPEGTTVRVTTDAANGELVLQVSDEGRGIPDDQLETIFGRFHQVDASDSRAKGGTGLGLAICRTIVEQHGGRIWAESAAGQGSTFTVTLPLATAEDPRRTATGPAVLVCDDDPSVRDVVTALLETHGYRAVPVPSGADLVDAALTHRPAAVLLDLLMPGVDGWQAATALREHPELRDTPVVVLSVLDEDAGEDPEDLAGRLGKPIDADALVAAVHKAVQDGPVSPRLLLVEDDDGLAHVLMERFRRLGVRVDHAPTAARALELCSRIVPDLLVLDLALPDQDGYAVVAQLRRDPRLRSAPLAVYSAYDLSDEQRQRLRLGETQYLTKSRVTPEEFEHHVLDLLGHLTRTRTPEDLPHG